MRRYRNDDDEDPGFFAVPPPGKRTPSDEEKNRAYLKERYPNGYSRRVKTQPDWDELEGMCEGDI